MGKFLFDKFSDLSIDKCQYFRQVLKSAKYWILHLRYNYRRVIISINVTYVTVMVMKELLQLKVDLLIVQYNFSKY